MVRAGGLEPPQALLPYGFSYQLRLSPPRLAPAEPGEFVVWTIPSPCSGCRRLGAARLVSTPSPPGPARRPPSGAWLGVARQKVSPSLSSSASRVSRGSTQRSPQVRCVYRFRHARVTALYIALGRPGARALSDFVGLRPPFRTHRCHPGLHAREPSFRLLRRRRMAGPRRQAPGWPINRRTRRSHRLHRRSRCGSGAAPDGAS